MSVRQFVFDLIFKADGNQAKAVAGEVKAAVAGVTAEAQAQTPELDRQTAATEKNSAAKRRAAKDARDLAAAEKAARDEAARAAGSGAPKGQPPGTPAPAPQPAPLPQPEKDALKATYVPMFAAQRAYQDELAKIARAEKLGALTKEESAAAQARLRHGYDRTVDSIKRADAAVTGNTGKIKLQAYEARNLAAQANDTIQSLALGMSPSQVFLQQGPQIVQVLGGVGNTLRFIRQSLTGMRVLMGGVTAGVIGGALAWDQYLKSTMAVETAAAGRGQRIATTPGMLESAARTGAADAGVSVRTGRDLTAQLLSTGQIGAANIPGIIGISKDFGATMGIDADAIGAELAKTFVAPGKAAEELYRQYGLVDAQAAEHVQRLVAQNRLYEAQAVLLEQLRANLVKAEDASTWIGRVGAGAGRLTSNAWNSLGRGVALMTGSAETPLEDRIAYLEIELAQAKGSAGAQPGAVSLSALYANDRIRFLEGQLAELVAERDAMADDGLAGEANRLGVASLAIAKRSPANADALREQTMRDELEALRAGRNAPDLSAAQRGEIDTAIEAQTVALDALITRKQRTIDLDRMEMQIATERNPLRRADLLGLQALIRASEQNMAVGARFTAMTRARRLALNETLVGAANQSGAMAEEAEARVRLNALQAAGVVVSSNASEWLERELAMRPLIAAAAKAEGVEKRELLSAIEDLENAYDALSSARKREALNEQSRASSDRVADLVREAEMVGRSAADRIRADAQAAAERAIRDMGLTGPDARNKLDEAAREAEARIEADRRRREYDLNTSLLMDGFDAAARSARNPVERADIEAQKEYARVLAETGDAEEAAAHAAQVRARAMSELYGVTLDMIRGQERQLDRLRLEASLAGATEATRARTIAQYEAELYIREQGIEAVSAEAQQIRDNAVQVAEMQRQTEGLADAWGKVRDAAEGAIDGPIDALLNGDISGALESTAKEITGLLAELAIKNPIKNSLLGTDYATLGDMGGLKGIIAQLFGGRDAVSITAGTMGQTVGSMMVTAGTVILGGAGITGLSGVAGAGLVGGAANLPGAPEGWVGPAGEVEALLRSVATGGGARPGAISGLNAGFADPLAAMIAEAQQIFGPGAVQITSAFRSVERQQQLWDEALQKYGSPEAARQWVAPPGQSHHNNGLAADLGYGSVNVEQWVHENAGRYGLGFRMGNEPWHIEPQNVTSMMAGAPASLGPAESALARFGSTATDATKNLGTLGNGFDAFGNALAQGLSGAGSGGGNIWSVLLGSIASSLGIPGFAGGGQHAGGLRVVGEKGPELEYTGPSTILPADLTRSIMSGPNPSRQVSSGMTVIQSNLTVNPVNNSGVALKAEAHETTNGRGERQIDLVMSEMVANAVTVPGGQADRALRSKYNVKRLGNRR